MTHRTFDVHIRITFNPYQGLKFIAIISNLKPLQYMHYSTI